MTKKIEYAVLDDRTLLIELLQEGEPKKRMYIEKDQTLKLVDDANSETYSLGGGGVVWEGVSLNLFDYAFLEPYTKLSL